MTAVPPRPAAPEVSVCSPDCGPNQDGGHWHHIDTERMVWAGYPRRTPSPPAPDATAGDGLRAALIEDVKTALAASYHYSSYRWPQQQDCHRIADDLLAGAAFRGVLAAAARDAELREAVISLAVRFETFGEVLHSVLAAEAYADAGASLRDALDPS